MIAVLLAATLSTSSLWKPATVVLAGQGLDVAATLHGMHRGCVEANTAIYGSQPSPSRLVVSKAALSGSLVALVWGLQRSGHKSAASTVAWLGGGIGAGVGIRNLVTSCR